MISKKNGVKKLFAALAMASTMIGVAHADPLAFNVGIGGAAEEQLWLMQAKPDVTPHQGKDYSLTLTRFQGNDKRFQAFESGALDFITSSANSAMLSASEGAKFKIVASLCLESKKGFATSYLVKDDSPIKSIADMKGKKIGIDALNSSTHLWAKLALEEAGINPDRDVTFIPISFPAQAQAVRSGVIDVGVFPQPFFAAEMKKGGVRKLFDSTDAIPFDEELMVVLASEKVLKEHPAQVRAFVSDLKASTGYYDTHPADARKALIDAHLVRVDPSIYTTMQDYYRDPSLKLDVSSMQNVQNLLLKAGFQRKRIDVNSIVDMSYIPKD
jgi:ABC-type nitrate/sulfonate/bicarbonate transport system substrate-binding protein